MLKNNSDKKVVIIAICGTVKNNDGRIATSKMNLVLHPGEELTEFKTEARSYDAP